MMIDVSDIAFTRCKSALENKYGKNNIFVSSTILGLPSQFPAASIRQIGAPSTQNAFNNSRCACISTIEVQAYSTKTSQEAKEVLCACADVLDSMGFSLIYGPEDISTQTDLRRYIARFRRVIGAGDVI